MILKGGSVGLGSWQEQQEGVRLKASRCDNSRQRRCQYSLGIGEEVTLNGTKASTSLSKSQCRSNHSPAL